MKKRKVFFCVKIGRNDLDEPNGIGLVEETIIQVTIEFE